MMRKEAFKGDVLMHLTIDQQRGKTFVVLLMICFLLAGCTSITGNSGKEHGDTVMREKTEDQIFQLKQLNRSAELIFSHVKENRLEQARVEMNALSQRMTELSFQGLTSIEGVQAISAVIIEAKSRLAEIQPHPEQMILSAAKLRLAVDALADPKRPLWMEFRQAMLHDVQQLQQAMAEQPQAAVEALQQLQKRYEMIEAAIEVQYTPDLTTKLDSLFAFLHRHFNDHSQSGSHREEVQAALLELERTFNELFQLRSTSAYTGIVNQRHPFLWTLYIGSAILIALGYAGWRKYRHEQNEPVVVRPRKERLRM